MDISLCIYTNCTVHNSSNINLIKRTFESINNTFDINNFKEKIIFVDKNPNVTNFILYHNMLKEFFVKYGFKIIETNSLSEGFLYSIKNISSKFVFQLEHDWIFLKNNIKHSLGDMLINMDKENIEYLRFNKRHNIIAGWDTSLQEVINSNGFEYTIVNNISNNPHIINREKYIDEEYYKFIKLQKGSNGIEENLQNKLKKGVLYGKLHYPPTIMHLDGRHINH